MRLTDCLDDGGIKELARTFPAKKANKFIDWFTYSPDTIDGKSKTKAYSLRLFFTMLRQWECGLKRKSTTLTL